MVENFAHFMDHGLPSLPVFLLVALVTAPILAAIHELGHGIAAVAMLPGRATLRIGREPPLTTFSIGRLDFRVRLLVVPWRFDATCEYGALHSRTEAILIALAGPFASLCTGILALKAMDHSNTGSVVHAVFSVTAFMALSSAIICLVPMTLTSGKSGAKMHSDGKHIVAALSGRRLHGSRL